MVFAVSVVPFVETFHGAAMTGWKVNAVRFQFNCFDIITEAYCRKKYVQLTPLAHCMDAFFFIHTF